MAAARPWPPPTGVANLRKKPETVLRDMFQCVAVRLALPYKEGNERREAIPWQSVDWWGAPLLASCDARLKDRPTTIIIDDPAKLEVC